MGMRSYAGGGRWAPGGGGRGRAVRETLRGPLDHRLLLRHGGEVHEASADRVLRDRLADGAGGHDGEVSIRAADRREEGTVPVEGGKVQAGDEEIRLPRPD